jgi:enoyl-CoA hydratase/3-hydroxyacyl-CoA dehydrogenase
MGSGIATALILSGIKVYLKEINSEFLQAGIQRIEGTTPRTLQKDY